MFVNTVYYLEIIEREQGELIRKRKDHIRSKKKYTQVCLYVIHLNYSLKLTNIAGTDITFEVHCAI